MDKKNWKKYSWVLPVAAVVLIVIFWVVLGKIKKDDEDEVSTVSVVSATESVQDATEGKSESQADTEASGQTEALTEESTKEKAEAETTTEAKTEEKTEAETEASSKKKNQKKKEKKTEAATTEATTEEVTEVAAATTEAPAGPQFTFRKDSYLEQHYEKHGIEMGFDNEEDYLAAANAVVNNPESLHKTEKEDGDDVYFLESTGEFVVVSTDGYIRTYFIPSGGKAYFDRQ